MSSAFYVYEGGRFVSTDLTRGPWDPGAQHAGPPAALIGCAIERAIGPQWQVGRVTYEILRPVPIEPLRVECEVVRPGRSVQLLSASLFGAGDRPLVRASAWCLARLEVDLPSSLDPGAPAVAPVEDGVDKPFFDTGQAVGYHTAMDYRFVRGGFSELGPATVWMRMRHPLIEGEEPTPLQRLLIVADTGNGASATLDLASYLFINVDLTVHMHRLPEGEWICLDAVTVPEPTGLGMSDSVLHDRRGPLGRAMQTLLIRER